MVMNFMMIAGNLFHHIMELLIMSEYLKLIGISVVVNRGLNFNQFGFGFENKTKKN